MITTSDPGRPLTCAAVRRAVAGSGITSPQARVTASRADGDPFTFVVTIPQASAIYAGLHAAAADPGCVDGLQAVAHAELRLGRWLGRRVRISEVTQRRSRVALTVHT